MKSRHLRIRIIRRVSSGDVSADTKCVSGYVPVTQQKILRPVKTPRPVLQVDMTVVLLWVKDRFQETPTLYNHNTCN